VERAGSGSRRPRQPHRGRSLPALRQSLRVDRQAQPGAFRSESPGAHPSLPEPGPVKPSRNEPIVQPVDAGLEDSRAPPQSAKNLRRLRLMYGCWGGGGSGGLLVGR
jgi:hypothetical protein